MQSYREASPRRACLRRIIPATAIALFTGAGVSAAESSFADLSRDVNEALQLRHSDLIQVQVTPKLGAANLIPVQIDGELYVMQIAPHSVRSADYQVFAVDGNGKKTPVPAAPINTFRGELLEIPGSRVTASVLDDGVHAVVDMGGNDRVWIEPVGDRVPAAAAQDLYVVYRELDVEMPNGRCGNLDGPDGLDMMDAMLAERREGFQYGSGGICTTELACDADFEYYVDYNSNVTSVQNRINAIINTVNQQYEDDVLITHVISTILVRTSSGAPYTSTQAGTLLSQLRNEWLSNQGGVNRDVTHLFTGKSLAGSTIGVAWGIGEICTSGAYCLSQSDWSGNFSCVTNVTAHELGHLWGAFHCDCTSFTMNPFDTCANQFSSGSINSITNHRNSRNCLDCVSPTEYCEASATNANNRFIERFTLADIDNTSGAGGYQDFTNVTTELVRGGTYTATVDIGLLDVSTTLGGMWIDRTGDLDFSDSLEEITTEWAGTGPYQVTFTLGGFTAGETRLRVRIQDGSQNNFVQPCGNTGRGEVEDYTVVIVDPMQGACCFPTFGGCVMQTGDTCAAAGGIYQGDGTDCAVCPTEPFGACCIAGACSLETEADCTAAGGTYSGNGALCETVTCDDPGGCAEDLDGDLTVGFSDLTQLLAGWGPC
jgi:hypothetical protein